MTKFEKRNNFILAGLSVLLLLSVTNQGFSQNPKDPDFQVWGDFTLDAVRSNHFIYGGDVGYRVLFDSSNLTTIYFRPDVKYLFNQIFNVKAGLATFYTLNPEGSNVNEFRAYQDFNIIWPNLSPVYFFQRVRLEERLFLVQGSPNERQFRIRYLLGIGSIDFKLFGSKPLFHTNASWEQFISLADSEKQEIFVTNHRVYITLGFRASRKWRYELQYISRQRRSQSTDDFEIFSNVVRIRLFHRIETKYFRENKTE